MTFFSNENKLAAARKIFEHVGESINAPFSVRLWDGSKIPLGKNVDPKFYIACLGTFNEDIQSELSSPRIHRYRAWTWSPRIIGRYYCGRK